MTEGLAAALTREHHEIDAVLEDFVAALERGEVRRDSLLTAFEALRRHIYLEEVFVFPPIREAGLLMPVLVMLREHGDLWRTMDTLTELLDRAGDDDTLREACRGLLARLEQHNAKEEPIIYPHSETDLSEDATAELARFLQDGRMPEGWTCQEASA